MVLTDISQDIGGFKLILVASNKMGAANNNPNRPTFDFSLELMAIILFLLLVIQDLSLRVLQCDIYIIMSTCDNLRSILVNYSLIIWQEVMYERTASIFEENKYIS